MKSFNNFKTISYKQVLRIIWKKTSSLIAHVNTPVELNWSLKNSVIFSWVSFKIQKAVDFNNHYFLNRAILSYCCQVSTHFKQTWMHKKIYNLIFIKHLKLIIKCISKTTTYWLIPKYQHKLMPLSISIYQFNFLYQPNHNWNGCKINNRECTK